MRDAEYRHALETAAKLGADIEWDCYKHGQWLPWKAAYGFKWACCDYRVKPEAHMYDATPRAVEIETPFGDPRGWWLCTLCHHCACSESSAREHEHWSCMIHVREVLKDKPKVAREWWILPKRANSCDCIDNIQHPCVDSRAEYVKVREVLAETPEEMAIRVKREQAISALKVQDLEQEADLLKKMHEGLSR